MYHDKKFFYKYVTAEVAATTLRNRSLKYSSPVLFNDPFDNQTRIDYGFTLSELQERFVGELYRLMSRVF